MFMHIDEASTSTDKFIPADLSHTHERTLMDMNIIY